MKYKKYQSAFTLVELIIVITILAILATIAFVSFQNYTSSAKNSQTLTSIKNIWVWLSNIFVTTWKFPIPDNATQVLNSGSIISSQWEIWENVSRLIQLSKYDEDFIYAVDWKSAKYQLLTFLWSPVSSKILHQTLAEDFFPYSYGNEVWIITNENNISIHKDFPVSFDIQTQATNQKIFYDSVDIWTWSFQIASFYNHPSLVALFHFNEGIQDSSNYLHKTEFYGSPTSISGVKWWWMLINQNQWWLKVSVKDSSIFTSSWWALTLSAWIQPYSNITTEWTSNCWSNTIIMRFSNKWAYMVRDHRWNICSYRYKYTPAWYHDSWFNAPLNDWTHIVQVWNGVDLKLYINGVQQWTSIPMTLNEWEDPTDFWKIFYVWIESFPWDSALIDWLWIVRNFHWVMDEVMIFNTDLTSQEIWDMYNAFQP